jgi:cytochrome c biogenesis protein CcmG/thiol:disulfide interchange protein DsbE
MGRIAIVVGFFALVILLAVGLKRDPREVPSPLIGKPAPAFELPRLAGSARFSPAEMRGKVWLLNVWASWCVTCRDEHPVLVDFAATKRVPLVGLNYKDQRDEALKWLQKALEHGQTWREVDRLPTLSHLRKDPRFAQMRHTHGGAS